MTRATRIIRDAADPGPDTDQSLGTVLITLLACAVHFVLGVLLLVNPHDSNQLINLCFVVFVTLIVSLQRAWSLLRGAEGVGSNPRGMSPPLMVFKSTNDWCGHQV
jgi:hypothetical protein